MSTQKLAVAMFAWRDMTHGNEMYSTPVLGFRLLTFYLRNDRSTSIHILFVKILDGAAYLYEKRKKGFDATYQEKHFQIRL